MKRKIHPAILFLIMLLVSYGAVYILHPSPFIIKLDIESVEIIDRSNVIIYKTDDMQKVDAFLNLFKYNTPYFPWQSNSSWKKIDRASEKLPPDIGIIFKNDLGEVRYSFFARLESPQWVEVRNGFFLPWSKKFFPLNPQIKNWQDISGTTVQT